MIIPKILSQVYAQSKKLVEALYRPYLYMTSLTTISTSISKVGNYEMVHLWEFESQLLM